ncbi:glutaredoxin family protein [Aestuariirhabdus sp. Z084]|uniref:glutaredoxin family protein n=1 Tax=Aestuariirhabdus haliotis TaxID=2918751 RepID=UPI00201B3E03|nr:glutaredoxin family protein [Aestuariirhabdus haliotis]MCL6414729.1 glutaredoxin family protein [Aestuariirhabdus haliotis]MCL6418661.1 glutaredoxin family protein [Aestuariirhabdus haliotis]
MLTLIFYTTSGCHLCDQALELLQPVIELNALQLELIDIAQSDRLIEDYGVRIPLIQLKGSKAELGWPFDEAKALDFLNTSLEQLDHV